MEKTINILKIGGPGKSHIQELICTLLKILGMKCKKRGYHISKYIDDNSETSEKFVNIHVDVHRFWATEAIRDGEIFGWSIHWHDNIASKILTNYQNMDPRTRDIQLVIEVMLSEEGRTLIHCLTQMEKVLNIARL